MSASEEAQKVAEEYLEKNNHSDFTLMNVEDKITKWIFNFETSEHEFKVEVSKSGTTVIQFLIEEK